MSKSRTLIEQICHALGKNNDASYAVVAVATAKGIFRPMFTMMDKHEDYETKKYTALREGLTEAIAIPCYLSVAWTAKNIVAPMICKSKANAATKKAAKTLSFLGVCVAALVVIPAACSMLINPIMDFRKKHTKMIKQHHLDVKEPENTVKRQFVISQTNLTPMPKVYSQFNTVKHDFGLKIGGGN